MVVKFYTETLFALYWHTYGTYPTYLDQLKPKINGVRVKQQKIEKKYFVCCRHRIKLPEMKKKLRNFPSSCVRKKSLGFLRRDVESYVLLASNDKYQ